MIDESVLKRFWGKVDKRAPHECWEWQAGKRNGYGQFFIKNVSNSAHRASVIISGRTLSDGDYVDHVCMNRACVNPSHLRVVDARISSLENSNSPAALNYMKTECPKGHPLSGDNLRICRLPYRECITCYRILHRQAMARRKARLAATQQPEKEPTA